MPINEHVRHTTLQVEQVLAEESQNLVFSHSHSPVAEFKTLGEVQVAQVYPFVQVAHEA